MVYGKELGKGRRAVYYRFRNRIDRERWLNQKWKPGRERLEAHSQEADLRKLLRGSGWGPNEGGRGIGEVALFVLDSKGQFVEHDEGFAI